MPNKNNPLLSLKLFIFLISVGAIIVLSLGLLGITYSNIQNFINLTEREKVKFLSNKVGLSLKNYIYISKLECDHIINITDYNFEKIKTDDPNLLKLFYFLQKEISRLDFINSVVVFLSQEQRIELFKERGEIKVFYVNKGDVFQYDINDKNLNKINELSLKPLHFSASLYKKIINSTNDGLIKLLTKRSLKKDFFISKYVKKNEGYIAVGVVLNFLKLQRELSKNIGNAFIWLIDKDGHKIISSNNTKTIPELSKILDNDIKDSALIKDELFHVTLLPIDRKTGIKALVAVPSRLLTYKFLKVWISFTLIILIIVALGLRVIFLYLIQPIKFIKENANIIQKLKLSIKEPPQKIIFSEVAQMVSAFVKMGKVLVVLRKYVPIDVVKQIISSERKVRLGGQAKNLTIMFTDIQNFTSISENMDSYELTKYLGEYFQRVTDIIHSQRGTVDKFIGDGVMAFWGAPTPVPDPPKMACEAALECRKAINALDESMKDARPSFKTRFGIHEGVAIVGNVGAPTRFNYTALGDSVNLASRLEGLNKIYGTDIIISESVYERVKERMACMLLDKVTVKGKEKPVKIYELIGLKDETSKQEIEVAEFFEQALELYFNKKFEDAALRFQLGAEQFSDKRQLFSLFMLRAMNYAIEPPALDWDGVFRVKVK